MENMQSFMQRLERELIYRNYSSKTIKAYSACIKLFLEYVNSEINSE
jgi:site-specific recombinase XerD